MKIEQATESAKPELDLGHLLTTSLMVLGKSVDPSGPQFLHL